MGKIYESDGESDGVYLLEIHHQSGEISQERYENSLLAWEGFKTQSRLYSKRKLMLIVAASFKYSAGTLLAAHNFPGLKGVLQQ